MICGASYFCIYRKSLLVIFLSIPSPPMIPFPALIPLPLGFFFNLEAKIVVGFTPAMAADKLFSLITRRAPPNHICFDFIHKRLVVERDEHGKSGKEN